MKRFCVFLTVFSIALTVNVHAQGWWQTYGTGGDEAGFCVQATTDGGYIISGHSDPLEGTWIIKTDNQGSTQWTQNFTERFLLGGLCVQQTSDGGYIVTNGGRLIKTNSTGDSVWGNQPALGWSQVEWVEQTYDGGYIAAGWAAEHTGEEELSYFILGQLDSEGNLIRNLPFGGMPGELDGAACVRETADRGFIASGWRENTTKLWVIRTDSLGLFQWDYYDADLGWGSSVLQSSDGGYVITSGAYLIKLNSSGDQVLWKQLIGEAADRTYFAVETADGGYAVTGIRYSSAQSFSPVGGDVWLCKTSSSGDVQWEMTYGGALMDAGYCVQNTPDGGYIIAGATESRGAGGLDFYLIKTDADGIVQIGEDIAVSDWGVQQSIGSRIVLSYSNRPEGFNASVYDASGRRVDELTSETSTGVIEWGESQPPGVYFIKSLTGNTSATKVILVR